MAEHKHLGQKHIGRETLLWDSTSRLVFWREKTRAAQLKAGTSTDWKFQHWNLNTTHVCILHMWLHKLTPGW